MTKDEKQGCLLIAAMFAVVIFLVLAFASFYAVFSTLRKENRARPQVEKK